MTKTSKTSKAATTLEVKASDETNGLQDTNESDDEFRKRIGDAAWLTLEKQKTKTDEAKVVTALINRLEVVRQLPEVDPDVKTKQAQGGIQHFKDVDDRTMNVVIHKGELYKQEHKGDDNE